MALLVLLVAGNLAPTAETPSWLPAEMQATVSSATDDQSGIGEVAPLPPGDQRSVAPSARRPAIYPPDGINRAAGKGLSVVAYWQPLPTPQPLLPLEAAQPSLTVLAGFRPPDPEQQMEIRGRYAAGPVEVIRKPEAAVLAPSDVGGLLHQSDTVQSVDVQRRSPVSLDPNIRGFKAGQIYTQADGVYWTPARRDLDTMLSKIDPGMIRDVVVIPGPYGLRYGPGFGFIDVVRGPTPRYDHGGFEAHWVTSGDVRTNGGQFYGRETVFGGSDNWGFRFSYGQRRGSDYRSGSYESIPASYHNRDVWGELSYDLNPYQRIDFAYQRLDQTDTEYPCQFFDIGFLGTYGFELRLTDTDPAGPWDKLTLTGWHNRTTFNGNTDRKDNPDFPVIQRVDWALDDYYNQFGLPTPATAPPKPKLTEAGEFPELSARLRGTTTGAVASSGARAAVVFGDEREAHLRVGADVRYLGQVIRESFDEPFFLGHFETNMPHSWMTDPGVYAEWSRPIVEFWTVSLGARADWIGSVARAGDLRSNTSLPGGSDHLAQNDVLYAFYANNQFELDDPWTLRVGFGHAQRPPTLVERYADGLFLSIVQSGFTRVIGDPQLAPERNWQIDAGLSADWDYWRGYANVFHAWVCDYITLKDGSVTDFFDARLVQFTNTQLATLVGFELFGEFDLAPRLSAFGTMSYVDGRDRQINRPLPAIPPLDSRVGLRLHDMQKGQRWGIEWAVRMVNDQERLGTIRAGTTTQVIEERTPGFTVSDIRAYYNYTQTFSLTGGIENVFNANYQEHLDLRLLGPNTFPLSPTRVWSPGITPYVAINWVY